MTGLLEKYKDIEASENKTNNRNEKMNILVQILLSEQLLECLKNSDEPLLSFFSKETIFTEIARFCFGINPNFILSTELLQQNPYPDEMRKTLSLRCLYVLLNVPSSFYSDLLSSSLEYTVICSELLLQNIKFKIMNICKEIFHHNHEVNNINYVDTHFFGFFSQVMFKIMKWNIPVLFLPDIYKQKLTERIENTEMNDENFLLSQDSLIINDQINLLIKNDKDTLDKIESLNEIIENFGLNLKINITNNEEKTEYFISLVQNISDPLFPNYKYISSLIISNIHENYAMQEFLVDILKSYPEALPDGTIVKRLSQIACNNFNLKTHNDNNNNNSNCSGNAENLDNLDNNNNKSDNKTIIQENDCIDNTNNFDCDLYFNKLKDSFCDRLDACYTLVDIFRSLPSESPIFYQFQDSTVLNNIIQAASIIYNEEKEKINDSFKHTVLTINLIDIVTKTVSNNKKLLSSIELPSNLIINEENVSDVTVSMIELYLNKRALMKENTPNLPKAPTHSNPPFYRRMSPSYHSFNSNLNNLTMFQLQSRNFINSKNDSKSGNDSKYSDECELFKLFFTSETLQNKLINIFFNRDTSKQNSNGNKSLIQSSSTNCINKFDSPTSSSTSFRCPANVDCSYPRSQSTGTWQQNEKSLSNEEISFLAAIANVPGLISNLELAYEKDHLIRMKISRSKSSNSSIASNSNLNLSTNNTTTAVSYDTFVSTSSNNETYSSNESSCDIFLDDSGSSQPKWTPACKFLALSLAKLNSSISLPVFNSKKWKSSIIPAIRKFSLILESNYGFGESISRHRSCSMNEKHPVMPQSFSSNIQISSNFPKPLDSFSINSTSSIEKRRNSFEKVSFSPNFFPSISNKTIQAINDDDDADFSIHSNHDEEETDNDYEYDDELIISDYEDYPSGTINNESENKSNKEKTKTCKNYPHSMNQLDNKCFSTQRANPFSFCVSPSFTNYPRPGENKLKTNADSNSSSSDSVSNIKLSTQQTLIQKNKNSPQQSQLSSSNSEGDDEYIIDI